ncbi:MAG: peptide-methionine (S)-S-oxide reductase MsrA [Gammaproteobacteria bacterium]
MTTSEALFAAGCFWGVEYYFKKLPGVLKTEVGYAGGAQSAPTYQAVCTGNTGHVEAIHIIFDPSQLSYQDLVKYFFEIHDPTQDNGQGPDIGEQYLSKIFYYTPEQQQVAQTLKNFLEKKGLPIATQIEPATHFWPAEQYHQDYYAKTGKQPYCHHHQRREW